MLPSTASKKPRSRTTAALEHFHYHLSEVDEQLPLFIAKDRVWFVVEQAQRP